MGLFMKMKDYIVSDLRLRIEGPLADSFDDMLPSFKPFAVERDTQAIDMVVTSGCELSLEGVECEELVIGKTGEAKSLQQLVQLRRRKRCIHIRQIHQACTIREQNTLFW